MTAYDGDTSCMYILSLSREGQRRLEGVGSVGRVDCTANGGMRARNMVERHLSDVFRTTSRMRDSSDDNGD